jgi:predicted metal-dependent phosphoesterase TrpH
LSRVLSLDMHVHTCHSHDGRETPRSMVERAAGIGLDGIAITDHNTQAGVAEALEAGKEFGILVVPGMEVSCPEGHVLIYGSADFGLDRRPAVGDLLDRIKRDFPGSIAAPAHPFDIYRSGMGWAAANFPFDAVETVNAHSLLPREVVLPLATRLGAGEIGGSDTHVLKGLGRARTVVDVEGEELLPAIRRRGRGQGGFDPFSLMLTSIHRPRGRRGSR